MLDSPMPPLLPGEALAPARAETEHQESHA